MLGARGQRAGEGAGRLLELAGVEAGDAQGVLDLGKVRIDVGRGFEQVGGAIEVPGLRLHHAQVHVGTGERRRDLASELVFPRRSVGGEESAPVACRPSSTRARARRARSVSTATVAARPKASRAWDSRPSALSRAPRRSQASRRASRYRLSARSGSPSRRLASAADTAARAGRGSVRSGCRDERAGIQSRDGQGASTPAILSRADRIFCGPPPSRLLARSLRADFPRCNR